MNEQVEEDLRDTQAARESNICRWMFLVYGRTL